MTVLSLLRHPTAPKPDQSCVFSDLKYMISYINAMYLTLNSYMNTYDMNSYMNTYILNSYMNSYIFTINWPDGNSSLDEGCIDVQDNGDRHLPCSYSQLGKLK